MDSMCRLCLARDAKGFDLFKGEDTQKYPKQVKETFQIELQDLLGWPSTACFSCLEKIKQFTEFKATIISSHAYLNELICPDIQIKCKLPNEALEVGTSSTFEEGVKCEPVDCEDNWSIQQEDVADSNNMEIISAVFIEEEGYEVKEDDRNNSAPGQAHAQKSIPKDATICQQQECNNEPALPEIKEMKVLLEGMLAICLNIQDNLIPSTTQAQPKPTTKLKFPLSDYDIFRDRKGVIARLKKDLLASRETREKTIKSIFLPGAFRGKSKDHIKTSPIMDAIFAAWSSLYDGDRKTMEDHLVPLIHARLDSIRRCEQRRLGRIANRIARVEANRSREENMMRDMSTGLGTSAFTLN